MDDRSSPIIIVKKKRKDHEGHHGGSWKVAYADFVTAMMAFFLLLWLLSMVSQEKRMALSDYFKNYNIFEESSSSGQSFLDKSSAVLDKQGMGAKTSSKGLDVEKAPVRGKNSDGTISSDELVKKLKTAIEEKLKFVQDQIFVDIVEGGVRIQMVDMEGSPMFTLGSAELTQKGKQILAIVADNTQDISNRIAIEGHTDSAPFHGGQITNWELSTSRASTARRELENNGLSPSRIARVVGYADQELYIKDNPRDSRNRRISIILLQKEVKKTIGASQDLSTVPPADFPRQPFADQP